MKTRLFNILKYIGLILIVFVLSSIPGILFLLRGSLSELLLWILLFIYSLLVMYFIRSMWKNIHRHEQQDSSKLKFTWKDFGITLILCLGIFLGNSIGNFIQQVFHNPSYFFDYSIFNDLAFNARMNSLLYANIWGSSLPWMLFSVFVFPVVTSIMEELVFRAFPVTQVCNPDRKILTGIITSSVFALVYTYMDLTNFPSYFINGAILYIAYRRRDNIRDSIILHILYSGIVVIIPFFLFLSMFG